MTPMKRKQRRIGLKKQRYCKQCQEATKHTGEGYTTELRPTIVRIIKCSKCGTQTTEPTH